MAKAQEPQREPVSGMAAFPWAQFDPSVRNYRTLFAASVKIITPLGDFYLFIPCSKYIH